MAEDPQGSGHLKGRWAGAAPCKAENRDSYSASPGNSRCDPRTGGGEVDPEIDCCSGDPASAENSGGPAELVFRGRRVADQRTVAGHLERGTVAADIHLAAGRARAPKETRNGRTSPRNRHPPQTRLFRRRPASAGRPAQGPERLEPRRSA